jgi:hypothetical protein
MNAKTFFISILTLTIFSGCETLLDFETPTGLNNITVETELTTELKPWEVRITESQAYSDLDSVGGVETALVIISDDQGFIDTLEHMGQGVYRSTGSRSCIPGRIYSLSINYGGTLYEASDYCRQQYELDTVAAYFLPENNGFIRKGWYIFEQADEWEEDGDYYEWEVYRNDTLLDDFGYILDEDAFRESSFFNLNIDRDDPLSGLDQGILPRPFPLRFNPGDNVRVNQFCINKGYYDFLVELQRQQNNTGGPFDSPPANPNSNISNGAYGYFAVKNVVKGSAVVPE